MKTVMCAGTFDVVHPGHLFFLNEAKRYGEKLVVVVARDNNSESFKGKTPRHNEIERLENVKSLNIVDKAVLGHKENIYDIISEIRPDVICLGYDQKVQKNDLENELRKRNLKVEIIRIDSFKPNIYKTSKMLK